MTDPVTIAALAALVTAGRPALESACRTFEALTGSAFEVAGAMLGESLYRIRVTNQLKFLLEMIPRLKEAGLDPRPLAAEFGLPLLEAVGNVGHPDLRKLWVGLVISGARDEDAQRPIYVSILRSLGTSDARALQEVAESLSAGLDRKRLAELMPVIGLLDALGVVEVSRMPFWHDGSLSSLEHARQVKALLATQEGLPTDRIVTTSDGQVVILREEDRDTGAGAPKALVTLSLLGASFMDAVEVREPGQRWNERAAQRTKGLLAAIHSHLPTEEPGPTTGELGREVSASSSVLTSEEEVTHFLLGYAKAMGWTMKDDRWTRTPDASSKP